jgi:hypothetical protein
LNFERRAIMEFKMEETFPECSALDYCMGIIKNNINSLLLPNEQLVVKCVHFGNLQDRVVTRVAQHFAEAINKGELK